MGREQKASFGIMNKLNEFRTVANLETLTWNSLETSSDWKPEDNVWWYNLSFDQETGQGSYLYKMGAGARSNPHEHTGPEEFFVLEGDLIDSDGYEYTKGDFVSLAGGSRHDSFSPSGCVLVVTHRGVIINLEKSDL
jgi:anti-sigma factor ChrR (cupin superfamily)